MLLGKWKTLRTKCCVCCTDDISDHLCERVLSVLFGVWLTACSKCFPSPSLWKTFRNMCMYWRHHEALVLQWHKVNLILTAQMIRIMYGLDYPQLIICEEKSNIDYVATFRS